MCDRDHADVVAMEGDVALPTQLLDAYLRTSFNVSTPEGRITVRCGRHSEELDRLLTSAGVSRWAYLTAYNPYSRQLCGAENKSRQDALIAELAPRYRLLHGEGVGDDGEWPPEVSVLALGMSRDEAQRVGAAYGQNAVVVGVLGQPAELLVCAPLSSIGSVQRPTAR